MKLLNKTNTEVEQRHMRTVNWCLHEILKKSHFSSSY